MALKISLTTVKNELEGLKSDFSECSAVMRKINSDYVQATNNEWNTPSAASYIDSLCNSFNDYIDQFNSKYQEGLDDFVKGVNVLAQNEGATSVQSQVLNPIAKLSKDWTGQSEDFNIPEDFAGFTNTHLTANVNELVSHLESMQSHISVAVENGLAGQFCTLLRDSLNSLKNSAKDVAVEYSGDAAKAAVEQDSSVSTIKSNT